MTHGVDGPGVKRAFDLVSAGAALVMLSPLMALVAVVVRVSLGSPVLFRQRRPGLGGTSFEILKFRTMSDARDAQGVLQPDGQRLTRVGRLLRRSSIDELPELLNVLRGDMSLVGPRPLLVEYLEHYSPEQARRHEVRPGLTGLAQVHGRNATTWDARLRLDTTYVDTRTLGLDLRIIARTVLLVVRGEGIESDAGVPMPKFGGPGT